MTKVVRKKEEKKGVYRSKEEIYLFLVYENFIPKLLQGPYS